MVVTCDIEFVENDKSCYFAGQLVSGTIVLKCDKVKEVKAIHLEISGYAQVLWTEKRLNKTLVYQNQEDYLSSNTYLMGSENSTKSAIGIGVQTYTFACQLPENCPSSFEGKYGCIRYTVKVSLVRPWKFDQIYIKAFTVLKLTDLNFETPQIRIPTSSETYRTFGCGPCTTEPLKVVLKIPQAGYVPGQNIAVEAVIINNSAIAVSEVQFSLVMIVRYISQNPMRHSVQRISVSRVKSDGVLRNSTRSLRDEIHIPATPPTCLKTCGIIQISYQVEMEVQMKSFQKCQLVTIPVIIGNIPLANNICGMEVIQKQPNRKRSADLPLGIEQDLQPVPVTDLIPTNFPPACYEESYHTLRNNILENDSQAFGSCEFAPLYAVYKIGSPTFEADKTHVSLLQKSNEP